ncbi:MAG TPA: YceI family protein [Bacteroidota bacterium]|nr:YceI family protein [Bacteroidota bacterium]
MTKLSVLLGLALLAAGPVAAQDTWQLDRAHSSIEFAVTHMLISEATGRFRDFDVTMTSKGDDFSAMAIEAAIKTASIATDNEYRDNDLLGADFFDAAKYPLATFKSTKLEKAGENKYRITGELTIRDTTKPVVLDATYFGSITDPKGGVRTGWKAETTINRFDYGVAWNRALEAGGLVVSKDVKLTIRLEMKKAQPGKKE